MGNSKSNTINEDNSREYQKDYQEALNFFENIRVNEKFSHYYEYLPITWQVEYLASKSIYFSNIPDSIMHGIFKSIKIEDLIININILMNYIFDTSDPNAEFGLTVSEFKSVIADIGDILWDLDSPIFLMNSVGNVTIINPK